MKVGDRVRVKDSVIFYHHPKHRNDAFDAKGMEGTVVKVLSDYQGRVISANYPVRVEFPLEGAKRPFRAHLRTDELEIVEEAN
ncbi:Ferredoxin-thioredoxin reductase, variable chain [Halomicronema hongdechloris C2206]|uniref:Ferredoxin-thioredoxin reductase, variable chain n=1 Tax=Halomicronema hongdechloris C2206 TaxID=1641165 RepID=A0A1Z3HIF2_9CYAN|nr:ferredoxin-thioredoxin reductase variable chain [Halomicronema hongdechloris]ASC70102.1 Ferredoxin-thioredoxin reductase, variable chain [Halomicronema hongdechloris C2206]